MVAIAISGFFLSGCSNTSAFQALERSATPTDALPNGVSFGPDMNLDKVLLVAEENGKKYFLGKDADEKTVCIAAFPVNSPTDWSAACTTGVPREGEILTVSGPDKETTILVSDGYDTAKLEGSGLKKIHDNILVTDG